MEEHNEGRKEQLSDRNLHNSKSVPQKRKPEKTANPTFEKEEEEQESNEEGENLTISIEDDEPKEAEDTDDKRKEMTFRNLEKTAEGDDSSEEESSEEEEEVDHSWHFFMLAKNQYEEILKKEPNNRLIRERLKNLLERNPTFVTSSQETEKPAKKRKKNE